MKMKNNYIDIDDFGEYRLGLTSKEIEIYIKLRTGMKGVKPLYKKFCKVAGVNTGAINLQGESLMYRDDVRRFVDKLLLNIPTYWD